MAMGVAGVMGYASMSYYWGGRLEEQRRMYVDAYWCNGDEGRSGDEYNGGVDGMLVVEEAGKPIVLASTSSAVALARKMTFRDVPVSNNMMMVERMNANAKNVVKDNSDGFVAGLHRRVTKYW